MRDLTIAMLDHILLGDVQHFSIDGNGTPRFKGVAIPDGILEGVSRDAHLTVITEYKDLVDGRLDWIEHLVHVHDHPGQAG